MARARSTHIIYTSLEVANNDIIEKKKHMADEIS